MSGAVQAVETIAIVGGGASGTLCASALLRHPSARPRRVVVVEPSAALGAGVAYGTESVSHLLNVRASGMSALADEPGHFRAWAQQRGIAASGPEFLPRLLYGVYLRDTLADAQAAAAPGVTLEHLRARVTGARPAVAAGSLTLLLDDGTELITDQVVLATGNRFAPAPWLPRHPCVVADPWRPGAVEALRDARSILVVGTGLTAVDAVLTLRDAGFQGVAHLVSSHGLFPARHLATEFAPRSPAVQPGGDSARTARGLVRALRADGALADDWRQTVDAIRPLTAELWRGLPPREQRRALRHAARLWEIHRHRMAPHIAADLDELRAKGVLTSERGRVVRVDPLGSGLRATLTSHGVSSTRDIDALIACVGPSADPAKDPLLAALIETGIAARHPLNVGLDVEPDGRVRTADGNAWSSVWAVGHLRRGADWEATAVPELRLHARDLAISLLGPTRS
jgi:uncharacterized NAD(P)/FAD-binding protein YdhS